MMKLPVKENFGLISSINNFFKLLIATIFEFFFVKSVGYKISDLNGKAMWFKIIKPDFNSNLNKFIKRKIKVKKFNNEIIYQEYSASYIQVNWFYFWHMRDFTIEDYIELIKKYGNNLELILANKIKKILIYNFVIQLRKFFLLDWIFRGGEKLYICTKCRKILEKNDLLDGKCPECKSFAIFEDMILLWDHI